VHMFSKMAGKVIGSLALSAVMSHFAFTNAADSLTIGSTAPALDIEHWVQDGKGKFKPVTKFEKGKVYVVEFWATWCGPCVKSMPHLVSIQNSFADKGVQIVSISNEKLDVVETFLERKVPSSISDKEQTFRELTSGYCLTTDPDESSYSDYMDAAGQNGIPCAFIVGKDQKIEWIGHPMSMDDPLTAIVDGNWDRAAFAEAFKEEKAMEELMEKIERSMQTGKFEKALGLINSALETSKSPKVKMQLKMTKVQVAMQSPELTDDVKNLISESYRDFSDNASLINFVAWTVYEKTRDKAWKDDALIKASRIASDKAASAAPVQLKAAILDTVSHLQHLEGDTEGAIKNQEKAVELADEEMKEELSAFLKELKSSLKK
jgi:thiol-disulfide isomerase/thioredoxin